MIRFTSPRIRRPTDRRYGTRRWRRLRADVVAASNGRCYAQNCTRLARVADHVISVYPGMPDGAFFGRWNLRASCQGHNHARDRAATVGVTVQQPADPSAPYVKLSFFNRDPARKALTRASIYTETPGNLLISGDYSRKRAG